MPLCWASRSKPRCMQESMPSASTSTFMNFKRVDVVLVPFDDLAVLHRRRLDRHQLVEPVVGEHEAAGMLRQMARRADQLAGELQRQAQAPVVQVEVQLGGVLAAERLPCDQPQTCAGEHPVRSSGRPSALPTSRSAPLAR